MSRILDLAHTVTADTTAEIATEPGSAEVALGVLGIAAVVFVAGVALAGRRVYLSAALRAGGLVVAMAVLAVQVHDGGWLTGRDAALTSWFVAHRTATLDGAAMAVTDLGSPAATVVLAVAVAALFAWRSRSLVPAVALIGTVGAAAVSSAALKALIGRDRPSASLQRIVETDHSFPSGHVTGTATLLGMIVVIAAVGLSPRVRTLLALLAGCATVVVAATRVYLGVHWLTDVIGGALVASFWITIGATALRVVEDRRRAPSVAVADRSPASADPLSTS
ncbi:phosphatase PAP2 family protein [Rhodococcus sp. ACT016]|uniref:phosphatase PAP2 family protein n=1 Tax=Rhodococcus sp. ACT016 TaxID=3134808 RepID=UPI003D2D02C2